jgi:glycerol-3-phosphate dehydrogenase
MADLITSCYSGRNKKCAEIFAKTGESWEKIEKVSVPPGPGFPPFVLPKHAF